MNFAPYQDESPEIERAFSPPGTGSNVRSPRESPPNPYSHYPGGSSSNQFAGTGRIQTSGYGNTGFGNNDLEGGRLSLGAFDTSLPIRADVEAMLAYLLLPPAGGVLLLLVEHKSDYVRYVDMSNLSRGIYLVVFLLTVNYAASMPGNQAWSLRCYLYALTFLLYGVSYSTPAPILT